jgi:hypothetical protein
MFIISMSYGDFTVVLHTIDKLVGNLDAENNQGFL